MRSNHAVVALIYGSSTDKVLGVSRKDDPYDFGLPGGKVDAGETLHEALIREVREETGLQVSTAIPIFAQIDVTGYYTTTFLTTVEDGVMVTQETGVVDWKDVEELKNSGSFQKYNSRLFNHLEDSDER